MPIAGTDEAGRGPLAGPVVAAAVILDPENSIEGLTDSKKLNERRRSQLYDVICKSALCYAIAEASVAEIDRLNILQASMLAMRRAVESLDIEPELVLVDGNRCPNLDVPAQSIVGGDHLEACISAASILSKVHRDWYMLHMHDVYPNYGFDRHKGYPTRLHLERLHLHGPCEIHRQSFKPVQQADLFG